MEEGTSVREHVLDMIMHFNIGEVNGGAIDEANQVSFILESLPKSFIPFQTNAFLNKIEFNLTTLLNELQHFQNLTNGKGKKVEANVATPKRKFSRGSSSKSKAGLLKPNRKIEKKEKGKTPKQNKVKKTTEKGKCYHCGENEHWLINCPKYLAQEKVEKEAQGEITLKVGTGEMVLTKAVGDLKLFFDDKYIILKNVLLRQSDEIEQERVEFELKKGRKARVAKEVDGKPCAQGGQERPRRAWQGEECSVPVSEVKNRWGNL
ncbi:gag/pol protein [Cucumis melo var. makuwa]|uniref:Gag/pol protein n=1 Tax=Cucumis melo var. makuwa TaxID=1194695 RepID=A0A5D3BD61_CUCMM|nr:gag/pol protein [Cucumis melo var. makuwa]